IFQSEQRLRAQILLPAGSDKSGRFETIVDDLAPGDYQLHVTTGGKATPAAAKVTIRENFAQELANISPDEARLKRIAGASGGEMLGLDEINQLPSKLRQSRERQTQFVEYRLWDSPYLFALIAGCLGCEWALRKRLGLA